MESCSKNVLNWNKMWDKLLLEQVTTKERVSNGLQERATAIEGMAYINLYKLQCLVDKTLR